VFVVGTRWAAESDELHGRIETSPSPCGTLPGVPPVSIAQDAAADELLGRDPLTLLLGMLLDQHMRQRSPDARGAPARTCARGRRSPLIAGELRFSGPERDS
jgi:hypothetical protein